MERKKDFQVIGSPMIKDKLEIYVDCLTTRGCCIFCKSTNSSEVSSERCIISSLCVNANRVDNNLTSKFLRLEGLLWSLSLRQIQRQLALWQP